MHNIYYIHSLSHIIRKRKSTYSRFDSILYIISVQCTTFTYTYTYTYAINNSSTSDQLSRMLSSGCTGVHGPVLQHPSSTVTVISNMTTTYAHIRIFIDAHVHMASGQLTAQGCFRIHSPVLQTTLRVP